MEYLLYNSDTAPIEKVRNNPGLQWNLHNLSRNPDLSIYDLAYLELPNAVDTYDWYYLSETMPIQDIRNYPHLPWIKEGLRRNPGAIRNDVLSIGRYAMGHVTMDDILQYEDIPWQ